MKLILSFIFLVGSLITFGQSAKKLNKQLRAELLAEQQKQDSVYPVFLQSRKKLDSLKEEMYRKLDQLYKASSSVRDSYGYISVTVNKLNKLDRYPNIDLKQFRPFTDYSGFVSSFRKSLITAEQFDFVSSTNLIDSHKRKEQNILLKERLRLYRKGSQTNILRFLANESAREQLEVFSPRVDSLLTSYQSASEDLMIKRRELEKEFEALRENYRLKGPKGFSGAYRSVFPDLHPLPKKNIVYEMDDAKTIGEFDAGPVKAAPMIETIQEPDIFEVVDEPASFPGGYDALKKYLADHIVYPPSAKEQGISGKVFLRFVISSKGEISNVKIMRGVPDCFECDQEAIRVIKAMPNWIPGKNRGKEVDSFFNLPVQFKL